MYVECVFFFSSRRRHTRCSRDWSSDVCSSDLAEAGAINYGDAYRHLVRYARELELPVTTPPLEPLNVIYHLRGQRVVSGLGKIGRASCREKCRSRWSADH